jgi:cell division septum initiation protein DivIVA
MENARTPFRVVLRGYETAEVDQRIDELTDQTTAAEQRIMELTGRIRELEAAQAFAAEQAEAEQAKPPSFGDFGARVGQILSLAEEEAAEIRTSAKSDFEDRQREAEQAAERVRTEADEYADQRRNEAETQAKKVIGDAHRQADTLREETERDAAARVAEAQAVYEGQRAKAAQAAADFETTLAERRDRVEQEFTAQFEATRAQLEEAQAHLEQIRGESQRIRGEAELSARRLVEDAQQQAADIVEQARAHADRIRAESERELAAATQRRDSINAQLTNVRQMLATLSNVAPVGLIPVDPDDEPGPMVQAEDASGDEAPAESWDAPESGDAPESERPERDQQQS